MKKISYLLILMCLVTTGCHRKRNNVWEESHTTSRFSNQNSNALWGNNEEQLNDEFSGEDEFIPLSDDDLKASFTDGAIPQARKSPGEGGLPNIDQFRNPNGALASIFRTVYFNTDDSILRGRDSLATLEKVADYLKSNPDTHVFVEGHCDERGPEAYNLSLGARRANYVRTQLIKMGADLNQVHTISYGKERPAVEGHTPDAWNKNRRAQFRIYQQ